MASRSETYERIVIAATELFQRFGTRMTVADIARRLGMSPANVYKFFPSKRAIMEAVAERRLMELRHILVAATRSRKTAWQRIEDLFHTLADNFGQIEQQSDLLQFQLMQDILEFYAASREERWTSIEEFHDFLRHQVRDLLLEGVEAGEMHVSNATETAAALVDCLVRATEPLLLLEDPKPIREQRLDRQLRLLARALA